MTPTWARCGTAVRSFVQAFEGTPTRLQIITFDTRSATLGATSGNWNRFFDLAEPADVDTSDRDDRYLLVS